MKLYYTPGACSMASHIVLEEGGLSFELERVDLATKKTETGEDYLDINPKGSVPSLRLDNGELLTEGPAILQYLANLVPDKKLAPSAETMERVRLQEWLNYISTEIHKNFSPLFNPTAGEDWKVFSKGLLKIRFDYVNSILESNEYLLGDVFTVADAYLFTVLNWSNLQEIDMSPWPEIETYMGRISSRPSVEKTLRDEGLTE